MIIGYKDSGQGTLTVSIKYPHLRYLNEFVKLKCASDLLNLGVFPNAKEITESLAAWNAVRKYLWKRGFTPDKKLNCYVIGDGTTPRTAALVAFVSNFNVYSIDPNLKWKDRYRSISRLVIERCRIEDKDRLPDNSLILLVHSHAEPKSVLEKLNKKYHYGIVVIPCCIPLNIFDEDKRLTKIAEYEDWGIHSPERTVKVYISRGMSGKNGKPDETHTT